MKNNFLPKTRLGKWSVCLNVFFLLSITTSIILVTVFKMSLDDHWWDVTVAFAFPASIIAFFLGIIAARKDKERSILVILSILIGLCTILFIFSHSLFIKD